MVELAIERATAQDLEKIETALKLFPTNSASHSPSPLEADLEFYLSLALAAHNEILFCLARTVNELLQDVRERTLMEPGRLSICYCEHEAIFAAVRDRDRERALAALKTHLDQVRKEVRAEQERVTK